VPALLDTLDLSPRDTSILCCGPEPMMKAVAARASDLGIAAHDIWISMERNMACAAGFCGLCQFGPAFVCRDGPVFRHDRIAPFLAVAGL
jgi:NAD(P)H-flavin reductase